jgi:hypothetical protein
MSDTDNNTDKVADEFFAALPDVEHISPRGRFAQSTIDATIWLVVHHPNQLTDWLRRHPPARPLAEAAYRQIQKPAHRVTAALRFKMSLEELAHASQVEP